MAFGCQSEVHGFAGAQRAPSKQADSLSMRLKYVNDDGRDSNESCRPINSHFEGFNLRPIKEPSATMNSTALAMSWMGPPKVRSSIYSPLLTDNPKMILLAVRPNKTKGDRGDRPAARQLRRISKTRRTREMNAWRKADDKIYIVQASTDRPLPA